MKKGMNVWKVLFCELKVFYCVQYCFLWPVYVWRTPLNSLKISKLRKLTVLRFQSAVLGLAAQSCLTLCNPMDCSPPGSSVHAILQARIWECVARSSSRGSSWPRDRTQASHIVGRFFSVWVTREDFVELPTILGIKFISISSYLF